MAPIEHDKRPVESRRSFLQITCRAAAAFATAAVVPPFIQDLIPPEGEIPTEWLVSNPEQIALLLNTPSFWTDRRPNSQRVLAGQLDPSQYTDYDSSDPEINTACGSSVLLTWLNVCKTLKEGMPSEMRIADVISQLRSATYEVNPGGRRYPFLETNGSMYPLAVAEALNYFDPDHALYEAFIPCELMSPGSRDLYYSYASLPYIKTFADSIFALGGAVIVGGIKYNAGHFAMMTALRFDTNAGLWRGNFIDPRGMMDNDIYGQVLTDVSWGNFWNNAFGIRTLLLGVIGVVPTIPVLTAEARQAIKQQEPIPYIPL